MDTRNLDQQLELMNQGMVSAVIGSEATPRDGSRTLTAVLLLGGAGSNVRARHREDSSAGALRDGATRAGSSCYQLTVTWLEQVDVPASHT